MQPKLHYVGWVDHADTPVIVGAEQDRAEAKSVTALMIRDHNESNSYAHCRQVRSAWFNCQVRP